MIIASTRGIPFSAAVLSAWLKEGVKIVVSVTSALFGLLALYDFCRVLRTGQISSENDSQSPQWKQIAVKLIILLAKISLILQGTISRISWQLISSLTHQTPKTFVANPCGARHLISIVAFILNLPYLIYSIVNYKDRAFTAFSRPSDRYLTDAKLRWLSLVSFFISRPFLHMINRIV